MFLPKQPGLLDIKPNVYADPTEAIAPNGKYLIQFKVIRTNKKTEGEDGQKARLEYLESNINFDS